jgi:hypothetical protein
MKVDKKSVLAGLLAASLAVIMSGCSTTGAGKAGEQAVMCSKCETVWVRDRSVGRGGTAVYRREKKMVCPGCETAVKGFFSTGAMGDACKACGGDLVVCPLQ